jgi:hypothetical protein
MSGTHRAQQGETSVRNSTGDLQEAFPATTAAAHLQSINRRDHRVDFLRGWALVEIFINHIPGNFYERFTHRNFGFSDFRAVVRLLGCMCLLHDVRARRVACGIG